MSEVIVTMLGMAVLSSLALYVWFFSWLRTSGALDVKYTNYVIAQPVCLIIVCITISVLSYNWGAIRQLDGKVLKPTTNPSVIQWNYGE
jgi:uncharacterized membrane protein YcjF (UPF0283 family)